MCKYCTSVSSELEYVNLSDSLSSIGNSDNRSPNSDLDRIEPNLLVPILYFPDISTINSLITLNYEKTV